MGCGVDSCCFCLLSSRLQSSLNSFFIFEGKPSILNSQTVWLKRVDPNLWLQKKSITISKAVSELGYVTGSGSMRVVARTLLK